MDNNMATNIPPRRNSNLNSLANNNDGDDELDLLSLSESGDSQNVESLESLDHQAEEERINVSTLEETVIQQRVTTTECLQRQQSTTVSEQESTSSSSTGIVVRRQNSVTEAKKLHTRSQAATSFSADINSTLPSISPFQHRRSNSIEPQPSTSTSTIVLPPPPSKYKLAFQRLYMQIPEQLRDTVRIAGYLFANFVLTDAEHESLKTVYDNKGKVCHCQQLIDILKDKCDEDIEKFLEVLASEDVNQAVVANWIKETAEKCQKDLFKSKAQTSQALVATNKDTSAKVITRGKRRRHDSDSDNEEEESQRKHIKLDLDLILKTVPPPANNSNITLSNENQVAVQNSGHLLFSIKFKEGIDDITAYLKQNLYQLKSELQSETGVLCSCVTEDMRTERSKPCAAMVSVGFLSGEREAFDILESKLIDFESHVIQQKAQLVSITEGCVRITLKLDCLENLASLEDDLKSGDFLCRITEWLHTQGYTGSEERPAFMLITDQHHIEEVRRSLQFLKDIPRPRGGKHMKTLMDSIENTTKNPKHDLELILRTMPKCTSTKDDMMTSIAPGYRFDFSKSKTTIIGKKGPLLMSVKYLKGSDEVVKYVKHSIYRIKSQITRSLGIPCSCITEDKRDDKLEENDATTLVSVGFEAGEKEAFKILESNMADFEEYVFKKTASVISVIEGCVKIRIKLGEKRYISQLYTDLVNGVLLDRISDWLVGKGYQGSDERPLLSLTVDERECHEIWKDCDAYRGLPRVDLEAALSKRSNHYSMQGILAVCRMLDRQITNPYELRWTVDMIHHALFA